MLRRLGAGFGSILGWDQRGGHRLTGDAAIQKEPTRADLPRRWGSKALPAQRHDAHVTALDFQDTVPMSPMGLSGAADSGEDRPWLGVESAHPLTWVPQADKL